MTLRVYTTPIAERQIASLRGPHKRTFDNFLIQLTRIGCAALDYRLTGEPPLPSLCVKHLRAQDRAVVAFQDDDAWILLVGPHNDADQAADVYTALYTLAGVPAPETPRTKPPCCGTADRAPALDESLIDSLVQRARPRRN